MGDVRDEQAEVTETLMARFPTVEPAVIHEQVTAAFQTYRAAPVQAYTAVLVQRAVHQQLRSSGSTPTG
jgi:hypothetical protein